MKSELDSNLELEKSKFSKLLLKINKIKSLLILFFLLFKFPFTENFLFFFSIVKSSELNFILLNSNKIFNIGTGKAQSIIYLTKLLKGKKIHIKKRLGETKYSRANISKVKKLLKWKPKISFEKAINELIKTHANKN